MTEQELREKLSRMTSEIPPETHRAFLSAALSGKEEKNLRRKITTSLILAVLLGLAVIGTAYAIITSQTAEFFGLHWNRQLGERLQEEGKIARIGESVTVGDIVITLDEIVYRDRSLYGVGTARPVHENDLLVTYEQANDPESFLQNEEALALVKKAETSNGRLLTSFTMPNRIGVDQGTMLMPGCIGYYDVRNGDGSITFSFEASDGFVISSGTEYRLELETCVCQMNEQGASMESTRQRAVWTVQCTPVITGGTDPAKASAAVKPASLVEWNAELIIPDLYRETGSLPVFRAVLTDFTKTADPSWFNTTGVREQIDGGEIRFNDHAVMMLSQDGLYYSEDADDSYGEAFTGAIVRLVWVSEWNNHRDEFKLEKTALSGITLDEAKLQAEALIEKLGISSNRYICTEALDMDLSRIRQMGAIYERAVETGELLTDDNQQPYDYEAIPESEEGYYLVYAPQEIDRPDASGRYRINLYVNSRGITYANIRSQFVMGGPLYTPERLITPEEALATLMEGTRRSLYSEEQTVQTVRQLMLCYEAVRGGDQAEGMVFVPAWCIHYQDVSDVKNESIYQNKYTSYALINAVDGTLIDASFR